jgi:ankyrin repeat protein
MIFIDLSDLKRIAKVFQSLISLIEIESTSGNPRSVPEDVKSLVSNFKLAHEIFERGINRYMHKSKHAVSEFKTVATIVEREPFYLTLTDDFGRLPIHCAAYDNSSASTYVPYLVKTAIRHGVLADEKERGGLLVKKTFISNRGEKRCFAPLSPLAARGNLCTLKVLQKSKPSLFNRTDITSQYLVHYAALNGQVEMMEWLLDLNPAAVYSKSQEEQNFPIHNIQHSLEGVKILLKRAIQYDPHHPSIGGLFQKNKKGNMAIDNIINNFGVKDAIKCIRESIFANNHVPILHEAIRCTSKHLDDIIVRFPESCFFRDKNGHLPIHVARENKMKMSSSLILLMNTNPNCVYL